MKDHSAQQVRPTEVEAKCLGDASVQRYRWLVTMVWVTVYLWVTVVHLGVEVPGPTTPSL